MSLAKEFGLSSRVQLEQFGLQHIRIHKKIKSRIIRKDAIKIIEIADTIRQQAPHTKLTLICFNNICSKSVALLQTNNIGIEIIDDQINT